MSSSSSSIPSGASGVVSGSFPTKAWTESALRSDDSIQQALATVTAARKDWVKLGEHREFSRGLMRIYPGQDTEKDRDELFAKGRQRAAEQFSDLYTPDKRNQSVPTLEAHEGQLSEKSSAKVRAKKVKDSFTMIEITLTSDNPSREAVQILMGRKQFHRITSCADGQCTGWASQEGANRFGWQHGGMCQPSAQVERNLPEVLSLRRTLQNPNEIERKDLDKEGNTSSMVKGMSAKKLWNVVRYEKASSPVSGAGFSDDKTANSEEVAIIDTGCYHIKGVSHWPECGDGTCTAFSNAPQKYEPYSLEGIAGGEPRVLQIHGVDMSVNPPRCYTNSIYTYPIMVPEWKSKKSSSANLFSRVRDVLRP